MPKLILRKSELRRQRELLKTCQAALPALDLKRRQLTVERSRATKEVAQARQALDEVISTAGQDLPMLGGAGGNVAGLVKVEAVDIGRQNVAGVNLPVLGAVRFAQEPLSFLAMPVWMDELEARLKRSVQARIALEVAQRRLTLLDHASRKIAQRVNLFERVLIPQIKESMRRIQVALGDIEREAVVRSKLAKSRHVTASVPEEEVLI